MSVNSKMTAIAEKIRSLLGISGKLGLDAMDSNLGTAVTECDSQTELIRQIKTALESKAAGGGSGGMVVCESSAPAMTIDIGEIENLNISFPFAENVEQYAFEGCNKIESVNLPVATIIGNYAFGGCINLTSVKLPAATSIGNSAFDSCFCITSVDLPVATSIGVYAFGSCESLATLILRKSDAICNLSVTAILGTKIATAEGMPTGEGFVYVPSALFEDYVANLTEQATPLTGDAATAEYIARLILRKIEDYPEICG